MVPPRNDGRKQITNQCPGQFVLQADEGLLRDRHLLGVNRLPRPRTEAANPLLQRVNLLGSTDAQALVLLPAHCLLIDSIQLIQELAIGHLIGMLIKQMLVGSVVIGEQVYQFL